MAGQRGDVVREPLAGAQPREHLAAERRRRHTSWPMNVTRPSVGDGAASAAWRRRASSAPKRSAWPRVSSLASGSSSSAREIARRARRTTPAARASSAIVSASTARVWLVDVEVVVRALLDARAAGASSGSTAVGRAERVHQREPLERPVGDHDPLELGEHALRRDVGEPRRAPASPREPSPASVVEPQLGRQPRQRGSSAADPRRTQSPRPSAAAARRGPAIPPNGSTGAPPPSGSAIALTVKSRSAEVGLDRVADERQQVDLPAVVAGDHAPAAERLGQRERDARRAARATAARRRPRLAGQRDVEVRRSRDRAGGRAPPRRRARRGPSTSSRSASSGAARSRRLTVAVVLARHAPRDRAQDLVVDRVEPAGELLGRLPLCPVATDDASRPRPARRPRRGRGRP